MGQEHEWAYVHPVDWPNCQPLRTWLRERLEAGEVGLKPGKYQRQLQENWECFHEIRCTRCRKKDRRFVFADECPVAQGVEPAGPPDPQ